MKRGEREWKRKNAWRVVRLSQRGSSYAIVA
ncbi:hypothetical protein [Clostridium phage Saumur]|nr:hypothetical protein [Clostridium phage Saumur]